MQTVLYRVNPEIIRTVVRQKELKFWWVAEQAGIHKTTLRRWLSGKIQRAQEESVVGLAQVLEVDVASLVYSEPL